ncbi:MAG: N-acetylneuraminate synthase family protein [Bacteroidota bacterium]
MTPDPRPIEAAPIHVIAEMGQNHNGELALAKQHIDAAVAASAHSTKLQLIAPEKLYKTTFDYSYGHYDAEQVVNQRRKYQLGDDVLAELKAYADSKKMPLTASVFDLETLEDYLKWQPEYVKLASSDLNNLLFINGVAERLSGTGVKLIISTGMATLHEIEAAVSTVTEVDSAPELMLMHCVSVYPAALQDMNLPMIDVLHKAFGVEVGLSDHTPDHHAAVMALAMGVRWFEKHYTVDKTLEGFDHAHAQDPEEFASYVQTLNAAYMAITPRARKLTTAGRYTAERARRGVYASRDLPAGHTLSAEDLHVVRPSSELPAHLAPALIGHTLRQPLKKHQAFTADSVEGQLR